MGENCVKRACVEKKEVIRVKDPKKDTIRKKTKPVHYSRTSEY